MLKERTPFPGRSVVFGRAAAKFPVAVVMLDKIGGAEGSDDVILVPHPRGGHVWFRWPDELRPLRIPRGWLRDGAPRLQE
jgi:hypothetical protein